MAVIDEIRALFKGGAFRDPGMAAKLSEAFALVLAVPGTLAVKADNVAVTTASTLDFGTGFAVTESPAGEANVVFDLTLDQIAAPVASVGFAQQQATQFRIENRTSDPSTPVDGQMWLRTDLA